MWEGRQGGGRQAGRQAWGGRRVGVRWPASNTNRRKKQNLFKRCDHKGLGKFRLSNAPRGWQKKRRPRSGEGRSWVVHIYLWKAIYLFWKKKSPDNLDDHSKSVRQTLPNRRAFKRTKRSVRNPPLCAPSPLRFWTFLNNVPSALCPPTFQRRGQLHGAGRTKGQEAWEAINPSLWTWSLDADSMTAEQGPAEWNYLRLDRFKRAHSSPIKGARALLFVHPPQ